MRLKTSCFNSNLFCHGLKSQLPTALGLILLFFATEFIPAMMELSYSSRLAGGDVNEVAEGTSRMNGVIRQMMDMLTNPVLIGAISILVAVTLFWYMYSRRSSYMLHAMPVSRMAHFISRSLAGVTILLAIAIICYGSVFCLVGFSEYSWFMGAIGLCFVETLVEILFFYSLALFVTMVCGNFFLAIVTYGVINLLWFFVNMAASFMHYMLLQHPIVTSYGRPVPFAMYENMTPLFPVYFFMRCHDSLEISNVYKNVSNAGRMLSCLYMLIPAVLLFFLAALLYKNKRIEKTGEMVAFDWCKVVFRVLFTVCSGGLLVGGVFFTMINMFVFDYENMFGMTVLVLVLMIIGGVIGFFVSEMLLKKTVHIFKGKKIPFLQGAVPLALMVLYVILLSTHVLGPKLIPDAEDVVEIRISGDMLDSDLTVFRDQDPELVETLVGEFKDFANDPEYISAEERIRTGQADELAWFRVILMEGGTSAYLNFYCETDEQKQKLLDTFMPKLTDGSHLKYTLLGKNADKLEVKDIKFNKVYLDNKEYTWDIGSFTHEVFVDKDSVDEASEKNEDLDGQEVGVTYFTDTDGRVFTNENGDIIEIDYLPEGEENNNRSYHLYGNQRELLQALRKDMDEGTVLPYNKENAKEVGDSRSDKVLAYLTLEMNPDMDASYAAWKSKVTANLSITTESLNTLAYLQSIGVIEKKK